jgi:molybdopterin-guanine dinucleotide biosynthesis protein A
MEKLLGVILCGGESSRMGSDKGLLPIRNTIWAKYMHEKLAALHIPVVYSINPHQVDSYSEYISRDVTVIDNSEVPGPVNGLLSAHLQYPHNNLLLMACDMLDLDTATITAIVNDYIADSTFDFYVYQDEEYAQPFCGIYTMTGLEKVAGRLMIGRLQQHSFQAILDEGYTRRLPISNKTVFRNYNSQEDIIQRVEG